MLKVINRSIYFLLLAGLGLLSSATSNKGLATRQMISDRPFVQFVHMTGGANEFIIEVCGFDHAALRELNGLSTAEWQSFFTVRIDSIVQDDSHVLPMLGTYRMQEDKIQFLPRFPLVEGATYTVRFDAARIASRGNKPDVGNSETVISASHTIPKVAMPKTYVTQVYPTTDVLPANQLKFYLHFSDSMNMGEAYRHIKLYDESGQEVPKAFLNVKEELWDETRQRFTLVLDPGRIKRGLQPNLTLGPPLVEGKRYRLLIAKEWLDGSGNNLVADYEKVFTVVASDRTSPNHGLWKIIAPQNGTLEPLILKFSEPLDYALLNRLIKVFDPKGLEIKGAIEIKNNETEWHFKPVSPWQEGDYRIHISALLEDLAGNSLGGLFDNDLQTETGRQIAAEQIEIKFHIGK